MILNDGLRDAENLLPDIRTRIQLIPVNGTIAGVRKQGILRLMNSDYEKIIFADADDYFSENRIEKSCNALESTDIYVNELTSVNEQDQPIKEKYFSKRLGETFNIEARFVLDKNILGLGNSAVRHSALREIDIPDDTIAVDWLLFTDMLLRGATARFKNDSVSYYRQHVENTAGLKSITAEKIQLGLKVQIQNAEYFANKSETHLKWLSELTSMHSALNKSEFDMSQILPVLENALPSNPFWWEEIFYLNEIINKS